MGNGQYVRFWNDKWCGDEPLSVAFPTLFGIAISKDAWVADMWDADRGRGGWDPCFSWFFNERELEEVDHFLLRIQAMKVHSEEEDRVFWELLRFSLLIHLGFFFFSL